MPRPDGVKGEWVEHHLKALKLPTVLRECVSVAAACGHEKADCAIHLLRLATRELLDRARRSLADVSVTTPLHWYAHSARNAPFRSMP